MHIQDQMTPNERFKALALGKDIDRLPIIPAIGAVSARFIGITNREYRNSSKCIAESQIKAYEVLGHDGVSIDYGVHPIAVALGGEMTDTENTIASMKKHPVNDINDLSKLDLDLVTKHKIHNISYEAALMLLEKISHEVGVTIVMGGPFSVASSILGIENILKATVKSQEQLHKVLDFSVNAIELVTKPFLKMGVVPLIVDPVSSGSLINKKKFDEFALPYLKEIIKRFRENCNGLVNYHACGDSSKILESILTADPSSIHVDNTVDLEYAKNIVGHKVLLGGNVDPVGIVRNGTEKQIEESVKNCYRKAVDSKNGFIIGTGCDIPIDAPIDNIKAFMEASRKCSKYPINRDNFI